MVEVETSRVVVGVGWWWGGDMVEAGKRGRERGRQVDEGGVRNGGWREWGTGQVMEE